MAAPCYIAYNAAMPTTAAIAPVTTGTAAKTMLQITPATTEKLRIVEWGYSFSVVPTAVVSVELIETDVAASVMTAHVAAGVMRYNDQTGTASQVQLGAALTAYAPAGTVTEGTPAATRLLAFQSEWGQQFKQQFPLGREPEVGAGRFLRIRATTATAISMSCYVVWEE